MTSVGYAVVGVSIASDGVLVSSTVDSGKGSVVGSLVTVNVGVGRLVAVKTGSSVGVWVCVDVGA
jgi:hypothetical protein